MDGQFAQQLANLQRAASRAGRGDGNSDNRSRGGRVDGRSSSSSGGGEARASGGMGRGDSGSDNRAHDDSSRRGDYRGNNNSNRHDGRGSSSYDSRDGRHRSDVRRDNRYDDRHRSDGPREHRPQKRGRDEIENNYDRSREYHHGRGSYRGRGGRGRFGDNDHRSRRNEWNQDGHSEVPLSEIVEKVAEKYKASKETDATVNILTQKKQRHIALLFLTIGDLPQEHIWKEWLKSASIDYLTDEKDADDASVTKSKDGGSSSDVLVSVLCHAKFPERIQSPWLRQRHLLQKHSSNNADDNNVKAEGHDTNSPKFHSRRPEWGSIEITRAMIDLLEEGLRIGSDGGNGLRYLATPSDASPENTTADRTTNSIQTDTDIPPVDRFVFVSESCLPVTTLKEMELALFGPRNTESVPASDADEKQQKSKDLHNDPPKPPTKNIESLYNKSWINARSTPNNGYARQLQWDAIRQTDIPPNLVWKADQWMVLTRSHGKAIASLSAQYLEGRPLWPALRKVRASDEMYFSTALSILGILHRPPGISEVEEESNTKQKDSCAGSDIRRRRITYCDWSMGAKNPASFTTLKEWKEVVGKARAEGCLLARKFVPASSIRGGGRRKVAGGGSSANNNDVDDGLVSVGDWISAVVKRGS